MTRARGGLGREAAPVDWFSVLVYGLLPGVAFLLASAAGLLKWHDSAARDDDIARIQSVTAAKDSTIALLSFRPDTAEKDVEAVRARLTGRFRDSYTQATRDVLVPNAKDREVTAIAHVPAAASVTATGNHAVVLVFVDQAVTIPGSPTVGGTSSVRVTLDKVGGQWLVSGFDAL
ncbi:hypothetical protein [Mycobacterium sp.]|uniref:hypothetical protein n=1 Tax=Mycobacterium sp. TaxID=1785 RepID=UPI0031DFA144